MPPKRKAQTAAAAAKAKKAKVEADAVAAPETMKDKIAKLKAADAGKVKKYKPDQFCPLSSCSEVHLDYDAMLNQTNIGHNNNKYYIIQVLKSGPRYYAWNRWGRVGEPGQNAMKGPFNDATAAIKDFEKKFKDKTKNNWSDRANFQAVKGKYTLLEMAGEGDDEEDDIDYSKLQTTDGDVKKTAPCTLDKSTQDLIRLIFDTDMFKAALQKFDLDTKKMPLGKLSKTQIARGFEVLEELEEAIEKKKGGAKINELTSKFYTVIPHSFGRSIPPPIRTPEELQKKYDMLAVLGDIELAQTLQKDKAKSKNADAQKEATEPHPYDVNYNLLNCDLNVLDKKSSEFKTLEKYFQATEGSSWRKLKLKDIWSMKRQGEYDRFSANKKIDNRKLLWHGTNVAVVTAILKTGLRIMPHSGGRVGRGIYFASEHSKSAGYVSPAQGKGIMFLNEVAIGKEHRITNDNSSLRSAPSGFDSVLACGQQEPDSSVDTHLNFDGRKVIIPQGKPKKQPQYSNSSFWQSEYLVYREDQVCMRYLLLFDM
ncbi:poly [ADP-ribose] polymerase [Plakobranchus ocellatus]|uniref:Poly [ADP-ribose] polymerase n=1 Tax=Plakobranchus ocellatus TaxID=259542 RepID=A0AAV4BS12_9GAST|nr:poly [ADP-ribose] polymerase [Plakobranchus ocellatus]